jgi:hypothetical protein
MIGKPQYLIQGITTYGDSFQYKFIRWNEENMCWIGYDHEEPSNTFKWLPESKSWITIIILIYLYN